MRCLFIYKGYPIRILRGVKINLNYLCITINILTIVEWEKLLEAYEKELLNGGTTN